MGFENTGYAKILFQQQIPEAIRQLEKIAYSLEEIACSLEKITKQKEVSEILNGIDFEDSDEEKYYGPF